ncbi:hypothetical protein CDAR_521301 [Caerostris darwini]|uniref:Uncharacterized protein n=1 Tax=Caerostris darwini TaxID=1538125 RepID=A0AAV4VAL0_9ARAC|nr:hypothetical protein CDAR_521301 [Caerostris darwini]
MHVRRLTHAASEQAISNPSRVKHGQHDKNTFVSALRMQRGVTSLNCACRQTARPALINDVICKAASDAPERKTDMRTDRLPLLLEIFDMKDSQLKILNKQACSLCPQTMLCLNYACASSDPCHLGTSHPESSTASMTRILLCPLCEWSARSQARTVLVTRQHDRP